MAKCLLHGTKQHFGVIDRGAWSLSRHSFPLPSLSSSCQLSKLSPLSQPAYAHIYTHTPSCRYIRTSSCRRTRGSIYARLVNRSASGWRMKWCARRISHVHVKYLLCKWYVGRGGRSATEIPRVSVFFGVYRWKIIGRPNNSCRWDIPAEGYRDHANNGEDLLGKAWLPLPTFAATLDASSLPGPRDRPRVEFVRAAFHKLSLNADLQWERGESPTIRDTDRESCK